MNMNMNIQGKEVAHAGRFAVKMGCKMGWDFKSFNTEKQLYDYIEKSGCDNYQFIEDLMTGEKQYNPHDGGIRKFIYIWPVKLFTVTKINDVVFDELGRVDVHRTLVEVNTEPPIKGDVVFITRDNCYEQRNERMAIPAGSHIVAIKGIRANYPSDTNIGYILWERMDNETEEVEFFISYARVGYEIGANRTTPVKRLIPTTVPHAYPIAFSHGRKKVILSSQVLESEKIASLFENAIRDSAEIDFDFLENAAVSLDELKVRNEKIKELRYLREKADEYRNLYNDVLRKEIKSA